MGKYRGPETATALEDVRAADYLVWTPQGVRAFVHSETSIPMCFAVHDAKKGATVRLGYEGYVVKDEGKHGEENT